MKIVIKLIFIINIYFIFKFNICQYNNNILMKEITNVDIFKPEMVDHDIIVLKKNYFNIYNNTIDEPFHKFYFYINDAKLTNIYNENIYRFGINSKNEKNKKLFEFMTNLFNHVKKLFVNLYPEIEIELPWKEYENYPHLINLFSSESSLYINAKGEELLMTNINKEQTYSLMIELHYIQLISVESNRKTSYMLKFKLNLVVVQEKILDYKSNLISSMNKITSYKPTKQEINTNSLTVETGTYKNKSEISSVNKTPVIRFSLDPNELLNKKNALNKISLKEKDKDKETEQNDKKIFEYTKQKSKLKKVETDEKSLIPILKKEHEDMLSNNSKSKIKEKTEEELEAELEAEFNSSQ